MFLFCKYGRVHVHTQAVQCPVATPCRVVNNGGAERHHVLFHGIRSKVLLDKWVIGLVQDP